MVVNTPDEPKQSADDGSCPPRTPFDLAEPARARRPPWRLIISGERTTGKTTALRQLGRLHELRIRQRYETAGASRWSM